MSKKKTEEWMYQLDRLPRAAERYADIGRTVGSIARFYGYEPIVVAPLEDARAVLPLIRAGLMDERTPVRCSIPNGEDVFLLPSGALGVVRAYFSHRMHALPHPLKLFFHAPAFASRAAANEEAITVRDEWGVAVIGEESTVAETGIAQIFYRATAELGINDASIELRLNATGCNTCRVSYRASLGAWFRRHLARLCSRSKRDLKRGPARIFSCPEERCRGIAAAAPQILDLLCDRCKKQLHNLLEFLDEAGIPYFLDPRFFREGSWYSEIVFELLLERKEAAPRPPERQEAAAPLTENGAVPPGEAGAAPAEVLPRGKVVLAEGGRLSQAASLLGGKDVPVAAGILFLDAVAEVLALQEEARQEATDVFFAQLGDLAKRRSFEILEVLREAEIAARESLGRDSIKTQLKIAERVGARFALILGQKEALDGTIIVREVASGIQETVSQEKLVDFLKKKLKK